MKVLLALSLLLFLDSVFSLGDLFTCPTFGKCPEGYTPQYSGRNMLNGVCYCKKLVKNTPCEGSIYVCKLSLGEDEDCAGVESNCSLKEIIDACRYMDSPQLCDRANQKIIKEKYAKIQKQCENLKNDCIKRGGDSCPSAAEVCDPDTTVQMCKGGAIYSKDICEAAEIEQEKYRAENTKYSCEHAQGYCRSNKYKDSCSTIPKFCDVQTAAKWCYKNDTNQVEKLSDEDCSRVVKKSQYLMFGKGNDECWKQVPLCEGGDSEACTKVATFCVKEVVSALCNANKMTSKRICKYAGSDKTTSPSHPGCDFFGDRCVYDEGGYCSLVTRYCDNHTIDFLCRELKITDKSICERARSGLAISLPVAGTVRVPNIFGL